MAFTVSLKISFEPPCTHDVVNHDVRIKLVVALHEDGGGEQVQPVVRHDEGRLVRVVVECHVRDDAGKLDRLALAVRLAGRGVRREADRDVHHWRQNRRVPLPTHMGRGEGGGGEGSGSYCTGGGGGGKGVELKHLNKCVHSL